MADVVSVTGFILSSMPVGDYDRRVVILSRELGKIAAFAKGARRPNSHLIGVTRPFIFGTFEVYRGRDSYTIQKANVTNYFAELAEYYGRENLDAADMINLLYVAFKALVNKSLPNELVRYIYEIRLIAVNGECPDFFSCAGCGSEKELQLYSYKENGMYCVECAASSGDGIVLQSSTLYTLQYIITAPLTKLFNFVVKADVLNELKKVVNRIEFITFDKHFKSKEMLDIG